MYFRGNEASGCENGLGCAASTSWWSGRRAEVRPVPAACPGAGGMLSLPCSAGSHGHGCFSTQCLVRYWRSIQPGPGRQHGEGGARAGSGGVAEAAGASAASLGARQANSSSRPLSSPLSPRFLCKDGNRGAARERDLGIAEK